jgi:hypothetical protein
MRDSASPTFLSGNWSMSSATMLSWIVEPLRLRSMALWMERRMPVTTTVSSWLVFSAGLAAGLSAAATGAEAAVAGGRDGQRQRRPTRNRCLAGILAQHLFTSPNIHELGAPYAPPLIPREVSLEVVIQNLQAAQERITAMIGSAPS